MDISTTDIMNIFLIFIILLIVLSPVFFLIYKAINEMKLKKNKEEFENRFQIYVPNGVVVKKMEYIDRPNFYSLNYPFWYVSRKDGTEDRRIAGNKVIRPTSFIIIGEYRLESDFISTIVNYVKDLREKFGNDFIEMNGEEIEKYSQIISSIKKNKSIMNINEIYDRYSSNPFAFEDYCANIFREKGYMVRQTSKTNDGGYDLILEKNYIKSIVECKCFKQTSSVSRPLIQKLVGANQEVHADEMIFITTSSFSKEAIEFAQKTGVKLINGVDLMNLIHENDANEYNIGNSWYLNEDDLRKRIPKDIYI